MTTVRPASSTNSQSSSLSSVAALYSVVSGLQAMAHPRPGRVTLLAGLALAAFLSFPPFWLAAA